MAAAESIGAGSKEWALAHEALSKLRLKRAGLDAEEGTWLLHTFRAATPLDLGYITRDLTGLTFLIRVERPR